MRKIFLSVVACFIFVLGAQDAKADPHALFYTTVGQQQLFFNMLAALDQADYVEPAVNTLGTPPGGSREELVERRSQTDFKAPQTDARITSTHTDLASVLTRNITLEGNDLWTAYQLQGRANDYQKRSGLSEVARLFCQFSLGLPICNIESGNNASSQQDRYSAITLDPVREENAEPLERGAMAALFSGTEGDQEIRKQILLQQKDDPIPYEFNPFISAAWARVLGDEGKKERFDNLISNTLVGLLTPQVNFNYYDRISYNDAGELIPGLTLASTIKSGTAFAQTNDSCNGSAEGVAFTDCYIENLMSPLNNAAAVRDNALAGADNIKTDQAANQDGHKPTKFSAPQPGLAATSGTGAALFGIGRIGTTIRSPASARSAATEAVFSGAVAGDLSVESAPATGQYQRGTEPLLNKPIEDTTGTEQVRGAQDFSGESTLPRVLQATDNGEQPPIDINDFIGSDTTSEDILKLINIIEGYYEKPQNPVGVEQNITPVHTERGILDALTAYDNAFSSLDTDRGGFTPGITDLWDDFCSTSSICS